MTLTTPPRADCDVRDLALAEDGQRRIEWAAREMPVLAQIRARFARERPLAGVRVAACLPVTSSTRTFMPGRTLSGLTMSNALDGSVTSDPPHPSPGVPKYLPGEPYRPRGLSPRHSNPKTCPTWLSEKSPVMSESRMMISSARVWSLGPNMPMMAAPQAIFMSSDSLPSMTGGCPTWSLSFAPPSTLSSAFHRGSSGRHPRVRGCSERRYRRKARSEWSS